MSPFDPPDGADEEMVTLGAICLPSMRVSLPLASSVYADAEIALNENDVGTNGVAPL